MTMLANYGPTGLLFAFAIAHALADFPLQGDYLAREKVRGQALNLSSWAVALSAHSLLHAGAVWIVSGSMMLGAVEFGLHWLIDLGKGEGRYGLLVDQGLHLACKAAYVSFLVWG
jgi:hypothetical protein